MPTPPRTSLPEIVAAGRSILEADGLGGLTMQRVAEEVGVRSPSLYKRVQSRGDLIRLIADSVADELAATMDAAASDGDPADDLRGHRKRVPSIRAGTIRTPTRSSSRASPRTRGSIRNATPGRPRPSFARQADLRVPTMRSRRPARSRRGRTGSSRWSSRAPSDWAATSIARSPTASTILPGRYGPQARPSAQRGPAAAAVTRKPGSRRSTARHPRRDPTRPARAR